MKKIYVLIIILLQFSNFPTFAESLSDSSYYHILSYSNTFSSFYPRYENSEGEIKTVNFIETSLKKNNINYKRYELAQSDIINSGSVTIDAIIPGKTENEIFMIFPINHSQNSIQGRDGSSNLAAALFLAEELSRIDIPQSVHIVFMGAEFGNNSSYPIGTKDYLANYYPVLNSAFFYFDFQFTPDTVIINHSGTGSISPLWLLKKSINALNSANLSYKSRPGINLINRLGLNDNPYIIDSYFDNEYPVIHFEGSYSGYYTPIKNKQSAYQKFLFNLATEGDGMIPSNLEWDSHYLFLKLFGFEIFISETGYVISLLILISLIIVYPFFAHKRFKKYSRTILRHFWNIPVIFFIMFLLLLFGTLLINIILQIQSLPSLWEILPFHFLTLKLTISVFLFLLTLRFFRGIHFSQRGSFYSASAIVFIIFDFLVLLSVDITFSYYLLPLLIFIFSFTIFKNRWLKFLFFALAVSVLLGGVVNVFLLDEKRVISLILFSPVIGNLIITTTLLPIALMVFRLQFLFRHNKKQKAKMMTLGSDILLALVSIFLFIYLVTFTPYTHGRKQPLLISENIQIDDHIRNITFSSTGSLGKFTYNTVTNSGNIETKDDNYTISGIYFEQNPEISMKQRDFLNRTQYVIKIESPIDPENMNVVLTGEENIILFDSNFNSISLDDKTTKFLIQANPEFPLDISFTLESNFNGELAIYINYSSYPQMVSIDTNDFSINHNIIFEKKLRIGKLD